MTQVEAQAASTGLADPARYVAGVPHRQFAWLRHNAPVSWVDEPTLRAIGRDGAVYSRRGAGFWAVTRHATVLAVSRAPTVFSSEERGVFLADPRTADDLQRARQMLTNMDGARHAAARRLVTPAFSPVALDSLREGIRRHAETVVARALAADDFDAVTDLAAELPLLVLADLLGIPPDDRGLLLRWSNRLVGFDDPEYGGDVEGYRAAFAEAGAYVTALAAKRRRDPGEDLISRLVSPGVDGRHVGDEELLAFWMLMVVAGNETTRHLISGALEALVGQPSELDRLVADPGLLNSATEELLRWVTPIMQFRRTAVRDTELDGQAIRAGDKVVVYYISANRDESVFDAPQRLDVARTPNPHLAFGTGPHACLGARLAHQEFRTVLELLLPHLPRLELVGPPTRLASNFMNGIKSMPARFRRK